MNQQSPQTGLARGLPYWTILLLLIFFGLAVDTAVSKTITIDEPAHIIRSVALWQEGDLRYQVGHMPLAHWLIGSLLQGDPALPAIDQLPSWPSDDRSLLANELLWGVPDAVQVQRWLLLARLPVIFSALLLGALLVNWSWRATVKSPPRTRLVASWGVGLLFAFSPNLLANAALATTDGLTTVLFTATMFAFWHYQQRPSTGRWLVCAVFTGLALATKLTSLALLPVIIWLLIRQAGWGSWRRYLPRIAQLGVTAGFTLWAVYLFEWRSLLPGQIPIPAATYFDSIFRVQGHFQQGHISFLLGERSAEGWWHYFAVATAVKTPAVVLLLLFGAIAFALYNHKRESMHRSLRIYLVPAAALFLLASVLRLNIGFRHILPMLPLLWLFIAVQLPYLWAYRGGRWLLGLLFGALALGTLRQHPHHLAYFNGFIGGPAHGYRVIGDSNLDWGQDLNLLQSYLEENGRLRDVYLSYYGAADPQAYGFGQLITTTEQEQTFGFAPGNPAPGLYAISVSHLQGLGLIDPDLLDWFRHREPLARLGYTINLYEVTSAAEEWIGICLDPGPTLKPDELDRFMGLQNGRVFYFDCRQSWVLPGDGKIGWYILPQQDLDQHFVGRENQGQLQLVYRHTPSRLGPSFDIYGWHGDLAALPAHGQALPVELGNIAELTGYELVGQDWWTSWKVLQTSLGPLTMAGHLYVAGPPPLIADNLGFSSEQWRPGDQFWQRFQFTQDGQYLETGFYNYLNGERLAPFVPLSQPE